MTDLMVTKNEEKIFYQAVASRDFRFDGRFFVGVKTTSIYCRPICPARPLRKNIKFFKSALEAEQAGFKPCLRCRPETTPFSPAWLGTSAVVKRALRLLADGALFDQTEKEFAQKLGMTERHLRRLFIEELGTTPKKISDLQRLNFARALILDTKISITDVALNSGFSSIRRFNDAFKKRFARNPSDLRRKLGTASSQILSLSLQYRPPYDWASILRFLKSHAAPGIEDVFEDQYRRLYHDPSSAEPCLIVVSNQNEKNSLQIEIHNGDPRNLYFITQKIRKMFDLDSDPQGIANLFSSSKFLKRIYDQNPGLRIPCGWDPYEMTVATVLGQFVSVDQARRLLGQLIHHYGSTIQHSLPTSLNAVFPTPKTLMNADLREIKTTARRKETIRELATQIESKQIKFASDFDPIQIRETLLAIKGIGPWSSEYICLRALGDPDAFPAKDLILGRILEKFPRLSPEKFKPWRSYLALYLWRASASLINMGGKKNVSKTQIHNPARKSRRTRRS